MKYKIDLDKAKLPLRLFYGVEYIIVASNPIVFSTSPTQQILYDKCLGNGTEEVYFKPTAASRNDEVWLFYGSTTKLSVDYNEFVLADHQPDVTPAYIEEEYPLFKKLMEYYFRYVGLDFEPSGFIHSLEKFAHIDETLDEFRESIYDEVLHYFPKDTAVDRTILAKYILDFYEIRGTEESIAFLLYVLTGQKPLITRGRDSVLIASNKKQGLLSDSSIVLQDNYCHQLFSYTIYLSGVDFSRYKEPLYKLVNPDGYLPFGVNLHLKRTVSVPTVQIDFDRI